MSVVTKVHARQVCKSPSSSISTAPDGAKNVPLFGTHSDVADCLVDLRLSR